MHNITSHQWHHSCHPLQFAFVKCKSNLQQISPHTYKNCDYQFCVERTWKKGNPYVLLAEIQISVATMETVRWFLKILQLELPCNPAVPLLYPSKGNINTILKCICTPVLNAAPPTKAKTWNQQEFIKKWMDFLICGIYTIKY